MSLDFLRKYKLPILLIGALLGLFAGRILTPTWLYVDSFQISETGEELLNYRSFHAALVQGASVCLFTLIGARLVSLGVVTTLVTTVLAIFIANLSWYIVVANTLDFSVIVSVFMGIPASLAGAFIIIGIWHSIVKVGSFNGR